MWVGGSELHSPHSPVFHSLWWPLGMSSVAFQSTVCKQPPLWIAKGSWQGGCSSWGLPRSRSQFSVTSPGASYRELLAVPEALPEPNPYVMCSWPGAPPACQAAGTGEWGQLSCLLTAPQASWASCSQKWGVPKGWTEKDPRGRAQPQEASSSAARGWGVFLMGRGTKWESTRGHVWFFPFVLVKGLICEACKPSWLCHMEGFLLLPWLERIFVTFALIVRDWSRGCFRERKSVSLPYVGAELVQSQDVSVNVPPSFPFRGE